MELFPNFISLEEEKQLVEIISKNVDTLKKRSVVHFGRHFDYDKNAGSDEKSSIPIEIEEVMRRISAIRFG